MKLAVSTCFDCEATLDALSAEVEGWLTNRRLGIQNVISLLSGFNRAKAVDLEGILWEIEVFSREIARKYQVYEKLGVILDALDRRFEGPGREQRLLGNLWRQSRGYMSAVAMPGEKAKLELYRGVGALFAFWTTLLQLSFCRIVGRMRRISFGSHAELGIAGCIRTYNAKIHELQRQFPAYVSVAHSIPDTLAQTPEDVTEQAESLASALRDARNDIRTWMSSMQAVQRRTGRGVGDAYIVAYDVAGSSDASPSDRDEFFSRFVAKVKTHLSGYPHGSVIEVPESPDDGHHVVLRRADLAWSLANFLHDVGLALSVRIRVSVFDAVTSDELRVDDGTGKTDGDAHAYAQRMLVELEKSHASAGTVILTHRVYKVLENCALLDASRVTPLGLTQVKGERLRDLELVLYATTAEASTPGARGLVRSGGATD